MKRRFASFAVALMAAGAALSGQAPGWTAVDRFDPALDAIVSTSAKLEVVKGDYFGWGEGPVWVPEGKSGYLLFSDMAANRIFKWSDAEGLSVFMEDSGFTGTRRIATGGMSNGRLQVIILGSNGLTLDREGRLVFATHGDRAVKRREKDGRITVLADKFEGKRLNGPNDLVYRSDGALYFSDIGVPLFGEKTELDSENHLFLLKDDKLQVLDTDPEGGQPNGLAFSPDEKYLYAAAGRPKNYMVVRYEVQPDGTLKNRTRFIDTNPKLDPKFGSAGMIPRLDPKSGQFLYPDAYPTNGSAGPGGIKVDTNGNVYVASVTGVWIMSPQGKHLGTIRGPAINIAFGGPDGRLLYLTGKRSLYRIPVKIPGIHPTVALRPRGRTQ